MFTWIDLATVGAIAYITNPLTSRIKRFFRLKGRRVQAVALFVAITISLFNELVKNPALMTSWPPGWPLFKAIGIGLVTGVLAVEFKESQKSRTPVNVDSEEGK